MASIKNKGGGDKNSEGDFHMQFSFTPQELK